MLNSTFGNDNVHIQVQAPSPSLIVIAQSYYPAWRAYLDGKRIAMFRANYAFQTVEVPSGTHEVLLRYQDGYFTTGVLLSGLGLVVCFAIWMLRKPQNANANRSTN